MWEELGGGRREQAAAGSPSLARPSWLASRLSLLPSQHSYRLSTCQQTLPLPTRILTAVEHVEDGVMEHVGTAVEERRRSAAATAARTRRRQRRVAVAQLQCAWTDRK